MKKKKKIQKEVSSESVFITYGVFVLGISVVLLLLAK